MASIHESSESTEQEEQDYIYGVVPKKWCTLSKHRATRFPKEGEWLTLVPEDYPEYLSYKFVLYKVIKITKNQVELLENWQNKGGTIHRNRISVVDKKDLALTPRSGWYPITEEMAIKMRILHGF